MNTISINYFSFLRVGSIIFIYAERKEKVHVLYRTSMNPSVKYGTNIYTLQYEQQIYHCHLYILTMLFGEIQNRVKKTYIYYYEGVFKVTADDLMKNSLFELF